jgi:hypothetical protein
MAYLGSHSRRSAPSCFERGFDGEENQGIDRGNPAIDDPSRRGHPKGSEANYGFPPAINISNAPSPGLLATAD